MSKPEIYRKHQKTTSSLLEAYNAKQEAEYDPNWLDSVTNIESLEAAIRRNEQKIKNSHYATMIPVYEEENKRFRKRISQIQIANYSVGDNVYIYSMQQVGKIVEIINTAVRVQVQNTIVTSSVDNTRKL